MPTFAVIESGVVVNMVLAESVDDVAGTAVAASENARIGATYADGVFTLPEVPEPTQAELDAANTIERPQFRAMLAGTVADVTGGKALWKSIWADVEAYVEDQVINGETAETRAQMAATSRLLAKQNAQDSFRLDVTIAEVAALSPLIAAVTGATITEQDIRDAWASAGGD